MLPAEGLAITNQPYIALLMLILNIPMDYVLMYGNLFTAMEPKARDMQPHVVQLAGGLAMVLFMASFKLQPFNIFARTKGPDWKYIKEILHIGVPNGISSTPEVLLFTVSVLMGTLSVTASASHQVAINIAATIFMILWPTIFQELGLPLVKTQ